LRSCLISKLSETLHCYTDLDVDLVATKDNWDVFTDPLEISVPVGDVLVGDSRGHVEHDDTTLTLDIVSVT
jgi:hypothetical protein